MSVFIELKGFMFDFKKVANEQDWTPRTQVDLLLEYIENQQSDEAFRGFYFFSVRLGALLFSFNNLNKRSL